MLFGTGLLRREPFVFGVTAALALGTMLTGVWKTLTMGQSRMPVFNLFLFGETLVWSAYGPYMTPGFRVGVYVFHIAAASFFHYVSSYVFAQRGAPPRLLRLSGILAVNAIVVVLGCASDRIAALRILQYVLSPEWFTLWVALHLAASDLLPWWRKKSEASIRSAELQRKEQRFRSNASPGQSSS